ncbi:MAG: thioredoxin [Acidobacteria bacterium]|nr:thioredoxin [Acidobacteriota bacterium]
MDTNQVELVYDVSGDDFQSRVIAASHLRPVLVDFWASWCGPCRILGPLLEKMVEEFGGQFSLARVNVEAETELAELYRVQSIPFVVLFREGKPVDEFVGAIPEEELREFLACHFPGEADQLVSQGEEKLKYGELSEARELFEKALAIDSANRKALLGMCRVAAASGDLDSAGHLLEALDAGSAASEEAAAIRALIQFHKVCEEAGGVEHVAHLYQQGPASLQSSYQHACCLVTLREYEQALQLLLQIVTKDRSFMDDGARKAMLEIFKIAGLRSPLAEEYRTRLARIIF